MSRGKSTYSISKRWSEGYIEIVAEVPVNNFMLLQGNVDCIGLVVMETLAKTRIVYVGKDTITAYNWCIDNLWFTVDSIENLICSKDKNYN
jgi:anthranilate phosphoribosyltransferase